MMENPSMEPIVLEAVVPFKQQFRLTDTCLSGVYCTQLQPKKNASLAHSHCCPSLREFL